MPSQKLYVGAPRSKQARNCRNQKPRRKIELIIPKRCFREAQNSFFFFFFLTPSASPNQEQHPTSNNQQPPGSVPRDTREPLVQEDSSGSKSVKLGCGEQG